MHTLDKKQKFIELRVEGESLAVIGEKLNVPKTTLWHWDREQGDRIRELQLINQDELESEWLASREERLDELHEVTHYMHKALISNFRRHADHLPIRDLFLYLKLIRDEIDFYRLKPAQSAEHRETKDSPKLPQELAKVTALPLPNPKPAPNSAAQPPADSKTVQNGLPSEGSSSGLERTTADAQEGTILAENGTPVSPTLAPSPDQPASTNPPPSDQMVQNGTAAPAKDPLPDQAPPADAPSAEEMVQNGTNSPENGTEPPPKC